MYTLLTGATGMLGRYVLRDLLLRGCNAAVLVRPSRRDSAADRVDALLAYWEDAWKRKLPRPLVFTGDIVQEGLGISPSDRRWLAANCQSIIHSAASLTFYEQDGEPWQSNVQGVRHVLDVCRELNIRRLYHVSTAYTCGLRDGVVYEDELDVGQAYGNDYERSKAQAEELVRQASWLDVAAIFRPSIIVGDSLTGFSSTFHGFYTPIRLVCALQAQLSHEQVFEADYMSLMGLSGDEGKNFVPVDWVSQAIVGIIERAPDRSRTYALVSKSPVTSGRVLDVIRAVTRRHSPSNAFPTPASSPSLTLPASDPVQAAYLEQLHTYRSYWRNDPEFDCANTTAVLPDLPCPTLTDDVLLRLAEWAIKSKFSAPISASKRQTTRALIRADRNEQPTNSEVAGEHARILTITGHGGGSWTFQAGKSGHLCCWSGRLGGVSELCIGSEAFVRVINQQATLGEVASAGDLVTVGRDCALESWRDLLVAAQAQSIVTVEA